MPNPTFQCTIVECHRFAEGPVALDESFGCPRRECRGNQMLEGRVPEAPKPWRRWVWPAVAVVLLGLVFTAIPREKTPDDVPRPTPPVPTPAPTPVMVGASLRLELDSLVSCGQNLLRLYRARTVALDTAESKWVNGQRVSTAGRNGEEALDRVKTTYQQERIFSEIAQSRQRDILSESSRYLEVVAHLMTLPQPAVRAAVARVQRESFGAAPRNVLAAQLVCRHLEDCLTTGGLTLDRVRTDYEENSLR